MIKDPKRWEEWETEYLKRGTVDYLRNLELLEAMYQETKALGAFPRKDPLEGLETKIRLAKALNVSTAP